MKKFIKNATIFASIWTLAEIITIFRVTYRDGDSVLTFPKRYIAGTKGEIDIMVEAADLMKKPGRRKEAMDLVLDLIFPLRKTY